MNLENVPSQELKFLIVDDDADALELVSIFLNSHYKCLIEKATNAKEAIKLLGPDSNFDFIISDYRMPGGSGFELLEFFSTTMLKTRFVLHTSFLDEALPAHDHRFLGVINKHDFDPLMKLIH